MNKRVVLLSGPLGSGKTTFVKGLAQALGVQELVKSPTYTYLHKYQINDQHPMTNDPNRALWTLEFGHWTFFYHFDLYRLPEQSKNPEHIAASIGLEEALNDPHAIVVIEWPERLPIPRPYTSIRFEKKPDHHLITYQTST